MEKTFPTSHLLSSPKRTSDDIEVTTPTTGLEPFPPLSDLSINNFLTYLLHRLSIVTSSPISNQKKEWNTHRLWEVLLFCDDRSVVVVFRALTLFINFWDQRWVPTIFVVNLKCFVCPGTNWWLLNRNPLFPSPTRWYTKFQGGSLRLQVRDNFRV